VQRSIYIRIVDGLLVQYCGNISLVVQNANNDENIVPDKKVNVKFVETLHGP
jgi:hypothetical protein